MNNVRVRRKWLEIEYLVLRLFSLDKELTFYHVCESLKLHQKTAKKILDQFEARDIISKNPMPGSFFYKLNDMDENRSKDREAHFKMLIGIIGEESVQELDKLYRLKA